MQNLLKLIQSTGKPTRSLSTLLRRTLKAAEECGELSEAVLSVTSDSNAKNKSHDDIIEEALDLAIVALDVALTKSSDGISESEQYEHVSGILALKLQKWEGKILSGETIVTPNTGEN